MTLKVHVRSSGPVPEIEVSKYLGALKHGLVGQSNVRLVVDSFQIQGPHGIHPCLLYKPAGINLADFLRFLPGGVIPCYMLKSAAYLLILALHFLHAAQVVHTGESTDNREINA